MELDEDQENDKIDKKADDIDVSAIDINDNDDNNNNNSMDVENIEININDNRKNTKNNDNNNIENDNNVLTLIEAPLPNLEPPSSEEVIINEDETKEESENDEKKEEPKNDENKEEKKEEKCDELLSPDVDMFRAFQEMEAILESMYISYSIQ